MYISDNTRNSSGRFTRKSNDYLLFFQVAEIRHGWMQNT